MTHRLHSQEKNLSFWPAVTGRKGAADMVEALPENGVSYKEA